MKHGCKITVQIRPRYDVVTTENVLSLLNTAVIMPAPPALKKNIQLQIYSHLAELTWFPFHAPIQVHENESLPRNWRENA